MTAEQIMLKTEQRKAENVFQDQVNTDNPISPNLTFLTAGKELLFEQMVPSCMSKV